MNALAAVPPVAAGPACPESDRLAALRRYAVLDTPSEAEFDEVTRIAALVCRAPMALVSLVEEARQFFKAVEGFAVRETPIGVSICAHAIRRPGLFIVPDLRADDRFATNVLVTGAPHLRFYAGAPLVTPDGHAIGTVCVLDTVPRPDGLTSEQAQTLEALARQAMTQLEHRRLLASLARREAELDRVQEIAGVGGLEVDLRDGFKNRRSTRYLRLHGLPPEAAEETHEAWVARIHPDDRERVVREFVEAVRGDARTYRSEYRIVRPSDGETRWVQALAEIERNPDGKALRLVGAHRDITDRKRDEDALRGAEERLRAILDTMPQMVWSTRPDGCHDYSNERWYDFTGLERDTTDGDGWASMFHPDDMPEARARWERALATGEPYEVEYRLRHRSGTYRWTLGRALPIRDAEGRIERWFGTCTDIHDLKQAEAEVAARRMQLETLLETAPVAVWFTDDLAVSRVMRNGYAAEIMGLPRGTTASFGSGGISHARVQRDGEPVELRDMPLQRAVTGEDVRDEEYEIVFADGRPPATLLSSASAIRDTSGAITGAVAVSLDISGRKRIEEARELLARELSHRIKNIFAVVQSLAALTSRGRPEAQAFSGEFRARIQALAEAHEYVRPHSPGSRSDAIAETLQGLIRNVLAPYFAEGGESRFEIEGDDVPVGVRSATAIALIVHEQATNAVKYGALSREAGRVMIRGTREGDLYRLRWQEVGGPPIDGPPQRKGFGTLMAARSTAGQLEGTLTHDWRPGGLVVELTAPVVNIAR